MVRVILRGPLYRDESDRGYAGPRTIEREREVSSSASSAFLSLKAENTVFGIRYRSLRRRRRRRRRRGRGHALSEIGQIGLDGHRQSFTPLPPIYRHRRPVIAYRSLVIEYVFTLVARSFRARNFHRRKNHARR